MTTVLSYGYISYIHIYPCEPGIVMNILMDCSFAIPFWNGYGIKKRLHIFQLMLDIPYMYHV